MLTLFQDFRFGLRVLRENPGSTIVAILTLALGIAACTTVFTWIDGLLTNPLRGTAGEGRLVAFGSVPPNGDFKNVSYRDFRDYRDALKLVSGIAVWTSGTFTIGGPESPRRIWGELVSGNYFAVMGVKPSQGRLFVQEEYGDTPGAYPVAVISDRLWRGYFNADPSVIGKTLRVNRHELTIIGVAPPKFYGGSVGLAHDLWVPITMCVELQLINPPTLTSRGSRGLFGVARLKPGVSIEPAREEVEALSRRLASAYPNSNQGIGASLLPIWKSHLGASRLLLRPLQMLSAGCLVMLLIVCANVANLLLARSVSRQKEFGIRLALGAGRARLARQMFTETLLLAGAGAAAGLPLAQWMASSLGWLMPPTNLPVALDIALNTRILGFSTIVCLVAAVISGVAPALLSVRSDLNEALKEGGRGGGAGTHSHRLRNLLVTSEVALAAVALIGAGLFAKSFENAKRIHPGFDVQGVLLSRFYLPGYTPEQAKQFCIRLRERLESSPGVSAVAYADTVPLGFGGDAGHDVQIGGYVPGPGEYMNFSRTLTAPGYFNTMRIPILEGRDFTAADDQKAPRVMIVNQTFARRFFGGANPVGRKVRVSSNFDATVVGLAKDIKNRSLADPSEPYFYLPFQQRYQEGRELAFFVRTAGYPEELAPVLRREASVIEPLATAETMPLSEYITAAVYPQKVAASLLMVLSLLSLLLAAVGLFSVMSYSVSQRTHEIGVRMAMGAQPGDVVAMVVRDGFVLTLIGLAAGIAAALAMTRFLRSMLVDVSPADPGTFAAAALILGLVALLANYLPARRATEVDPVVALRSQ